MTQEHKDLLLKDLCARLPYGVKVKTNNINILKLGTHTRVGEYVTDVIEPCKPYLFPLSSMTEEQKVEYDKMSELDIEYTITQIENNSQIWTSGLNRFNWLLKNHFDVYGLIPMDLAIDSTNLEIYC
jgi:hypothetical protein